MTGMLSLLIPVVVLLIMFACGILIGLTRVRVRAICVAASFAIALIAAFVVKGFKYYELMDLLRPLWNTGKGAELLAFIQASEPLQKAITACGGAFVAPAVFFAVFFALSIVSGVICYIIFFVTAILRFLSGDGRGRKSPLIVLAYSAVQTVLLLIVIMTPMLCYADCLPPVLDSITDAGVLPEQPEYASDVNAETLNKAVERINQAPLTVVYRKLGGDLLCRSLTIFEIDNEKTTIATELEHLTDFLLNVYKLGQSDIASYDKKQAEAIRNLSAGFEESKLVTAIVGEVIYGATEAWTDESGDGSFIGIKKPDLSGDSAEIFAPMFDHLLVAFNGDARNSDALAADFNTIANVVLILSEDGVLEHMSNTESSDDMVRQLTTGKTVSNLVAELKKNPSLAILADDITNIGMRAVGSTIQISSEDAETFNQFTDEIADALNGIRVEGSTPEEQKANMTQSIRDALENSNTDIEVDDSILDIYSEKLLEEFADTETITPEDVSKLFEAYTSSGGDVSTLPDGLPEGIPGLPEANG